MPLPPGPVFLLRRSPAILLPFGLVFAASKLNDVLRGDANPLPYLGWAYALCFPVFYTIVITGGDLAIAFDAWWKGAVMPPRNRHWSPGNIVMILTAPINANNGYLGEGLEKLFRAKGNIFNLRALFLNRIFFVEPEYIKFSRPTSMTMRKESHLFISRNAIVLSITGHSNRVVFKTLLGQGIFSTDGELWKFHRGLTRPFFARERISDFENFQVHADQAIEKMRMRLREGYAVNFHDLVGRFTLDTASSFLFARDMRSLDTPLPYPYNTPFANPSDATAQFLRAFNEAQNRTARRIRLGDMWPLAEFWEDRVAKQMVVIHGYLEPIIQDALKRKEEKTLRNVQDGKSDDTEATLIDYLVEKTNDPKLIRDEVLNILIAGRDTTAATLSSIIYQLAQHPHIVTRLREEIMEIVGPSREPTIEDFRDMKYLRAVCNETLRLFPAVPFNFKESLKTQVLPNLSDPSAKPWYIPANTRVGYSVIGLHRRTDLWGPDALEFDPDRFIDERLNKYLIPNPFIFLPFNAGPRICVGQQFAYHEMSYFLVRLLQQFKTISLALDSQPPNSIAPPEWANAKFGRKSKEKITMCSNLTIDYPDGVWVRMEEAKDT
ncbi:cytochrome P450 [Flagelloscypha sp. PMI_526]|nr:cytochrome P450 [Flagelloscypha sp. PMI_526]